VTLASNQVIQAGTIDQAHDDEQSLGHLKHIVNRDDARVIQAGNGPGFTLEALDPLAIEQEAWSQLFKRHQPIQFCIFDPVDDGKATLPNLF
jgi:hypothetical protein